MKRSDSPNAAAVDSLLLDAKGKEVLLECYPDGEILFWSDDGIHLEFDRKHTALIIAALRKQEKLPKPSKDSQYPEAHTPQQRHHDTAKPQATPNTRQAASTDAVKQPNRRVAKEGPGWGATVIAEHKTHRYYYDKRDQARDAEASHRIGEAGRIA
ncbi:MAG: hypothetical protein NT159_04745 [Proteobacteria bacterium]|nr:hypothetical protein [Pseudomonadota bacterium]